MMLMLGEKEDCLLFSDGRLLVSSVRICVSSCLQKDTTYLNRTFYDQPRRPLVDYL